MKDFVLFCILSLTMLSSNALAEAPRTLAGITLGSDISEYGDLCRHDTDMTMRDEMYLNEVSLVPDSISGVRGGSISYGNCANKGVVVRVKIKFHDRSMKLFDELLKRYKNKFGKPDEWLGDAFHNIIAWKWKKSDDKGEVTFTLTYSKDPELRPGVSIKITDRSLLMREYQCYQEAHKGNQDKHKGKDYDDMNLAPFIPSKSK